jgi:hypothetical protein
MVEVVDLMTVTEVVDLMMVTVEVDLMMVTEVVPPVVPTNNNKKNTGTSNLLTSFFLFL